MKVKEVLNETWEMFGEEEQDELERVSNIIDKIGSSLTEEEMRDMIEVQEKYVYVYRELWKEKERERMEEE